MGPRRLAVAVPNNVIGPDSSRLPPVTLLRRNFAQALCRQTCPKAPAARLRGGTGPWMLRCEAPAPGLHTTRGHLQAVSGNLKIGASLCCCCCCCCCWCCCWCRCCCWCGSALRLDSPRASRASDAAGGVAGGSDRGWRGHDGDAHSAACAAAAPPAVPRTPHQRRSE